MSRKPSSLGPIAGRRRASLAARALSSCTPEELDRLLQGGPLPRLRARLSRLAEDQRYEEAARLRDRVEALEQIVERLRSLERLRKLEVCLIAPMLEPGWRKAFFVSAGSVCAARALPPGPGARLEIGAGLAICRSTRDAAEEVLTPEQAEELVLIDGFVRRPPPELAVLPLDAETIAAHLAGKQISRAPSRGLSPGPGQLGRPPPFCPQPRFRYAPRNVAR